MERRLSTGGRRLLVSLALAAMIAPMVLAACGGGERKQVPDALGAKLQQILDSAVASRDTVIPGTALYVSQPDLGTWTGAAGKADVDTSTPMRADDTFSPGSIMKPLVATVVLQLAEEGKLGLDDRLPEVLPRDVVARIADADRITVRMLLDHTSGVPEYDDTPFDRMVLADPHRIWTVDELLDRSASRPRPFEPGKGYAYSNTDYNLLGLVIEHATGQSWRTAVRDRVIDRLGLKHTSLPEPGKLTIDGERAHGYELVNGKLRDLTDVDPSMAGAAGGNALVTTTEDLSRFLHALLAGELFEKPATLDAMLTFVRASSDSGIPLGYGLGLERYQLPGGLEVIGHMGTAAGYRAFVGRLTAQKVDFALMINTGQAGDPTPTIMSVVKLMVAETAGGAGAA